MPRPVKAPQTAKEKQELRLAKAATKREAKARERKAKADGTALGYEETIRARRVREIGVPPDEWVKFLREFEQHYRARHEKPQQPNERKDAPPSLLHASPKLAAKPKK
jgi:hypothetical protein